MPYDASPEFPNALGLSPENYAIMQELLAWLDTGGDDLLRFDYNYWLVKPEGTCSTAACIGGWLAWRIWGDDIENYAHERDLPDRLGISEKLAYDLFYGGLSRKSHPIASSPIAARCVRNLLATGEVDWDRAFVEAGE